MAAMIVRRPDPTAWLAQEVDRFTEGIRALPLTLDAQLEVARRGGVRELMITVTRAGCMTVTIEAEIKGIQNLLGWRLRGTFPARHEVQRQSASSTTTAEAIADVRRWVQWWITQHTAGPANPSLHQMESDVVASMVSATQGQAKRVRESLLDRLGLTDATLSDLLLGLETVVGAKMEHDEAVGVVRGVRDLLSVSKPLSSDDAELFCDAFDLDVTWLITGNHPSSPT
jgi:hypothetical protein